MLIIPEQARFRMVCSWSGWSVLSIAGIRTSHTTFFASPCLSLRPLAAHSIIGRLYCSPRALWKLNWFLRDFGYDIELLGRDEIDDKNLVGLRGVVKISHAVVNGTSLLNLDGFAPAAQWEELSTTPPTTISGSEVA